MQDDGRDDAGFEHTGQLSLTEQEAAIEQWFHCQMEVATDLLADLEHWMNDEHGDVSRRHTLLMRIKKARTLFDTVPSV